MIFKYYSIPILVFYVAGITLLAQGKVRVEASFEPTTITLSNTSTYKIIHGSQQALSGSVPSVDGLNFSSPPRTLRSASFVNGVPSVRFELTFTVTPEKTGTYTVSCVGSSSGERNLQGTICPVAGTSSESKR